MLIMIVEQYNEANEYVRQLSEAYQKAGHTVVLGAQNFLFSNLVPEVVHIQWPEAIYQWRYKLPRTQESINLIESRISWYKSQGSKIIYTAHNLEPHVTLDKDFENLFYETVLNNVDMILHHGSQSISLVKSKMSKSSNCTHLVVPHGPYQTEKFNWRQARQKYNIPADKWVLLNFGRQRRNKGGKFTSNVYDSSKLDDYHLFTIGPRAASQGSFLKRAATVALSILTEKTLGALDKLRKRTTITRPFAHTEIPAIVSASDIFFLGHQQGLNSGVLALAISYGKPVIYPNIGNFREQAAGWEWAESYEVDRQDSAIEALNNIQQRLSDKTPGETKFDNTRWLTAHSWKNHIKTIETAIEATLEEKK